MLKLGRVWQYGGVFLVATCLTTAQAQDNFQMVATGNSADNGEEASALRSEISELRSNMKSTVSSGYDQGPTCGCNAHAAPSCGCQGGCDAEVGCGCASACCEDNCCDCCCIPGCSCGWYAAGEVAWLRPSWQGFPAAQLNVTRGGINTRTALDNDYDYGATPRIWIGYTGCNGLGVRASWWQFDHDSKLVSVTVPAGGADDQFGQLLSNRDIATGDTLSTQQSLQLETGDFEFTNCFEACGGDMVVSFGVRYAKMRLIGRERLVDHNGVPFNNRPNGSFADYSDEFEGWGPTVGLEFIRPLCCTGLSFYSSLRGSVVFGDAHYRDTFRNPNQTVYRVDVEDAHEQLAIGDLRIGLQYCKCGWFARGGWQDQYWNQVAQVPNFSYGAITAGRPSLGVDGLFFELGAQY